MKIPKIPERAVGPFVDRTQAGKELGRTLVKYKGKQSVVLGIPRGGVVVACHLAQELDADLDIMLSRKIGAPGNPELAIGAVGEDGQVILSRESLRQVDADKFYIEEEAKRQTAEIKRRREIFRAVCPKISLKDRIAILTDDGVATGATFEAALLSIRAEHPQQLIAAIPVGPRDTIERLEKHADELVCLKRPSVSYALSQFYADFTQVDDGQVLEILRSYNN